MSKPAFSDAQCWRVAMQLASQLPTNPEAAQRVLEHVRAILKLAEGGRSAG